MDQEIFVTIASLKAENEQLRRQTRVLASSGTIEYHGEVGPLELLKLAFDDCLEMVKAGELPLRTMIKTVLSDDDSLALRLHGWR